MQRNVLTVFLASPGDLTDERKKAKEIVDRLCQCASRKLGWHIELLGWEDTIPSYARPQSLINKDVDKCDLFIGILWRRWGQSTGKYSSGFEEEFIRARNRCKKTSKPDIMLFFKSVDQENLADPGEQLRQVQAFKEDQIRQKNLLFREFNDVDEWANYLYDSLLSHLIDVSSEPTLAETQEQTANALLPKEETITEPDREEKKSPYYPKEIIELFGKITNELTSKGTVDLDSLSRTRLLLQSAAWFSQDNSWGLFENHEINQVYANRKTWELSPTEMKFIIRSFLGDQNKLRPGWFWLNHLEDTKVDDILCHFAGTDRQIAIKRAAYSLLRRAEYNAPRELIERGLSENDEGITLDSIRLLRDSGNTEYLDLLKPLLQIHDPESVIKTAANNTRIELIYRKDPNAAFNELISSGTIVPPFIQKSLNTLNLNVDHELLAKALEMGAASVRRFAAQYMRRNKTVNLDHANVMLKDTDALVRKEGLLSFFDLNQPITIEFINQIFPSSTKTQTGGWKYVPVKASEFVPLVLQNTSPQELLTQIHFYETN